MKSPEFATPEVYMVMLDCWRKEPTDRISFQRIVLVLEELSRTYSAAGGVSGQAPMTPGVQNFEYLTMGVPAAHAEPPPPPGPETGDDGYLISTKEDPGAAQVDADGYLISMQQQSTTQV